MFAKDRDIKRADLLPPNETSISPRDKIAICKFFKEALDVELDRENDAIADAVFQQFPGQVKRLQELERRYNRLPNRPNLPPALVKLRESLEKCTRSRQVLHPLTQGHKKVAYFLIDAFRYEMATELIQEFEGAGTTVTLKGRYAELPSITAVGMNILAPVHQNGRVILAGSDGFKGFKTGEYTVRKPDERVRAMSEKSVDNISAGRRRVRGLTLAEICNWSTTSLKQSCANTNLVVVHSREIDDAGEANVGLATFETWLQQIKSAWNHLKSIGINEFVFTADHGFLLQDQTTQEKPYRDSHRRYVLAKEPRLEEEMVTVSLNALKYEGQEGYLLFRKDTAVFASGIPGVTFVHGGNSLQERVIRMLVENP
jgi:PglZ domain